MCRTSQASIQTITYMPKTFLVSDASINTYKCRVFLAGLDSTAFESNPVMLFMHQRGNVIGMWENLKRDGDKLFADAVFDLEDEKLGKDIGGKVERGFLKAASIGIVILEASYNEVLDCIDIIRCALQEISIVDVGSNQNALQLYDLTGEPLNELKLAAHLDQYKPATTDTTITNKPIMELKAMAAALGLPETATEEQVMTLAASGHTALTELNNLKLQLAKERTDEAVTLIDAAIADKRIVATQKETYLKLFDADHESTKAILAGIAKPANLVQFATQGAAQSATTNEDAVKRYDTMDKAGTLLNLAKSDFAQFSSLYEAKFGSKPDKINFA